MTTPTHWRVPANSKLSWRLEGMIMEQALAGPVDTATLMQWLLAQGDTSPEATLDQVFASLFQLDFIEPVKREPSDAAG
jgi:hypothetical protein